MTDNPARRDLLAGAALSLFAAPAAARSADGGAGALAMAQSGSASFDPGWRGAVERPVEGRLADMVSILDFIPPAEHMPIRARTSTTDLARYFNAAIAHIEAAGGGELYIPAGRYRCGSTIALCRKLRIRGASRGGAHIQFTHRGTGVPDGSGFKSVHPSNASTPANIFISDLWVEMLHGSNLGAGFYDNGGTYVVLRDATFSGGKFGVVFDQTEVSGIYTCELAGQLTGGAGLWIVNGPDITAGNQGGYTNQITVDHNCNFSQNNAHAIIDDGGDCHYFGNNNINGGGCKFAGIANLTIMGGEFESVVGRPTITFTYQTHYSAAPIGACSVVLCNGIITQPAGQPCIVAFSLYNLHMTHMSMTAHNVAGCVSGTNNIGTVFARQNVNHNSPVPIFDTYSSSIFDDGNVRVNTEPNAVRTLGGADIHAITRCTSPGGCTVTVPPVSKTGWSIGHRIMIEQAAAGPVALSAGPGVTLHGTTSTAARYQLLELIMTSADRWLVTRRG
jgi:hypothetical protein